MDGDRRVGSGRRRDGRGMGVPAVMLRDGTALFEPDVLVPAQFRAARMREHQAEKALLLAVLEAAVFDVDRGVGDALEWFNDDTPRDPHSFTFRYCCQHLGLDAERIRAGVFPRWNKHGSRGDWPRKSLREQFRNRGPLASYA